MYHLGVYLQCQLWEMVPISIGVLLPALGKKHLQKWQPVLHSPLPHHLFHSPWDFRCWQQQQRGPFYVQNRKKHRKIWVLNFPHVPSSSSFRAKSSCLLNYFQKSLREKRKVHRKYKKSDRLSGSKLSITEWDGEGEKRQAPMTIGEILCV